MKINLLDSLYQDSMHVKKTSSVKKIIVQGEVRELPVYAISLDLLYYNNQNDRIISWLSKYVTEHGEVSIEDMDHEEYNKIIQEFIIESGKEAVEKTKKNIHQFTQIESGVVLADGRIVDGNRRFTCLRMLHKEHIAEFGFFQACILDNERKYSEKDIKLLELQLQHGTEEKVGYDPIDRLVGIYTDIVEKKLLTIAEYKDITSRTESEIKKELDRATLMVEYLEFINAPKQYYIAREEKLDGPINEMINVMKACSTREKEDFKNICFTYFITHPEENTDLTRTIRELVKIAKSPKSRDFIINMEGPISAVAEEIECYKTITPEAIKTIRKEEASVKKEIQVIHAKASKSVKIDNAKERPIKAITEAGISLKSVEFEIVKILSAKELQDLKESVENISKILDEIKEKLNQC